MSSTPVITNEHVCSLRQLETALVRLDEVLGESSPTERVTLKVVGGFALMSYGIRAAERAFTVDIDTITPDLPAGVTSAIHQVAEERGLERDWINNDSVIDGEETDLIEAMYEARWVPAAINPHVMTMGLKHIEVQIADVPTLTRAKIIAADVAEFSGRVQDVPDLMELLAHQNITCLAAFDAAYPQAVDEYPQARAIVAQSLAG